MYYAKVPHLGVVCPTIKTQPYPVNTLAHVQKETFKNGNNSCVYVAKKLILKNPSIYQKNKFENIHTMKYYLKVKINQYIQCTQLSTNRYYIQHCINFIHIMFTFLKSQNTTYSMIPLNTAKNKSKNILFPFICDNISYKAI